MPGVAELAIAVAGVAILSGLFVWLIRKTTAGERTQRKHAQSDLDDRETFEESYRGARRNAVSRAIARVRARRSR